MQSSCTCVSLSVGVYPCVCSQPPMTHSVVSSQQAGSKEEAVFIISPGCHSHGAYGCYHHLYNYTTMSYSHPPHGPCLCDAHQLGKTVRFVIPLLYVVQGRVILRVFKCETFKVSQHKIIKNICFSDICAK